VHNVCLVNQYYLIAKEANILTIRVNNFKPVVPNRWVVTPKWAAEEWPWGCKQPQQFAKSQIFRTAHINILC